MRHLLIKLFVLDYFFKVFGTTFNIARVNVILYPLISITGLVIIFFTPYWPIPTTTLWVLYFLNAIVLFFGFIYFRFKPVKWEELDNFQKFQYGTLTKLKGRQYFEWVKIFHKVRTDYFS